MTRACVVIGVTLLGLVVTGCTPPRDLAVPDLIPGQPLASWTSELTTERGKRLLFRNDMTEPLKLWSVTLVDCLNITVRCGEHPLELVLEPGESREVLRVLAMDRTKPYHFEWRYRSSQPAGL